MALTFFQNAFWNCWLTLTCRRRQARENLARAGPRHRRGADASAGLGGVVAGIAGAGVEDQVGGLVDGHSEAPVGGELTNEA